MLKNFLPLLPGNSFVELGKTRFHKSHHFERDNGLPILSYRTKPGIGGVPLFYTKVDRYPSLYPRGESPDMPTWLAFDKQVLSFDSYFQESIEEMRGYTYQIRRCKIYFYLEDGTMKVIEPKVKNSGIPQGTLISRQRIPRPNMYSEEFYDILDLNIGKEVELFGRVFKITNCDGFTRVFLNRLGITVPDPIDTPIDPYEVLRKKEAGLKFPKKPNPNVDTRGKFLEFNPKVLRFYGYFDNRMSEYGLIHRLEVQYYLADDTIAVKEDIPPNTGRDTGILFCKRGKLPKNYTSLLKPGDNVGMNLLNVLTSGGGKSGGQIKHRYVIDPLGAGPGVVEYYTDKDLAIGTCIDCYGRKIVLTGCDNFTKEYYNAKYGIDDFTPIEQPMSPEDIKPSEECVQRELPPYNGFGTYEDSAGNCFKLLPVRHQSDFVKFLHKDKLGLESHCLRFKATMISKIPENKGRKFIISLHLCDDGISIFELAEVNSGYVRGAFLLKEKVYKPGQDKFSSKEPEFYTAQDFYIGNIVNISNFLFELTEADEYALRYMEINSQEFLKSNIKYVMDKVREALRPVYKEFTCQYIQSKCCAEGIVHYCDLRNALKQVMGDCITEHEIVTIARKYNAKCPDEGMPREKLRSVVQTQLKRMLFKSFDKMEITLRHLDENKTCYLDKDTVFLTCLASNLPLDRDIIKAIIDRLHKNEHGQVSYMDLIQFLDYKQNPAPAVIPDDYKREVSTMSSVMSTKVELIDYEGFLKDLDLEKTIINQSS